MDGDTIFAMATNNENDTIIPNFTKRLNNNESYF